MKNCDVFLIFAQNIVCGYTLDRLSEAVLPSTHNLCFGAKIRKNVYPCKPEFYYIKVGYKGVFITWTRFRDVFHALVWSNQILTTDFMNEGVMFRTYATFHFTSRNFWFQL